MSAGVAGAAADLRARLGALEGREDEQVARHRRRPARGGAAVRARSAAAVSREGDRLRHGRRLQLGAVRRSIQRRSREQSRQPGEPHHRDGGALSRRAGRRPASEPGRLAGVAAERVADYRTAMDAFALEGGAAAAFRIVDAANEYIASTEPWALARDPSRADALSAGPVRRRGSGAGRRGAAAAGDARVGRGDPAPRRRDEGCRSDSGSATPNGGERRARASSRRMRCGRASDAAALPSTVGTRREVQQRPHTAAM